MRLSFDSGRSHPRVTPWFSPIRMACTVATLLVMTSPWAVAAPISHAATGRHLALGYAGDRVGLPEGTYLRNRVEILRIESVDPRLAGRRTLLTQGLERPDGTRDLSGTWIGEAGTWAGDAFLPSGGVWDGSWSGTRQADGSLAMTLSARGRGGTLEGLELKETATRAAGADLDPALPLVLTGRTALSNQWSTVLFQDDFEDGKLDPEWRQPPGWEGADRGIPRVEESGGRLTLHMESSAERTALVTLLMSIGRAVTLEEGQTLELRADVVGLGANRPEWLLMGLFLGGEITPSVAEGYDLLVGSWGEAKLIKVYGPVLSTDLSVLSGNFYRPGLTWIDSVTRSQRTNAVARAQVLDRAQGGAVLFDRSWTDTPAVDPTPFSDLDVGGPPYLAFSEAGIFLEFRPNSPVPIPLNVSVSIDNFSLRLYESSPYETGIENAILLTPPASTLPYVVEGAPTVNGPWEVLSAPPVELHGTRHLVVPVSGKPGSGFFRIK